MIDKFGIIKYGVESLAIHKAIGLKVEKITEQKIILRIPYAEVVIGDIRSNRWHGGILSLVMDVAGGMAGASTFNSLNDKITTIDLRVDYLEPPASEDLLIEGEVVKLGNRVMVAKMKAYHQSQTNKILAEGKGVYYMLREETK